MMPKILKVFTPAPPHSFRSLADDSIFIFIINSSTRWWWVFHSHRIWRIFEFSPPHDSQLEFSLLFFSLWFVSSGVRKAFKMFLLVCKALFSWRLIAGGCMRSSACCKHSSYEMFSTWTRKSKSWRWRKKSSWKFYFLLSRMHCQSIVFTCNLLSETSTSSPKPPRNIEGSSLFARFPPSPIQTTLTLSSLFFLRCLIAFVCFERIYNGSKAQFFLLGIGKKSINEGKKLLSFLSFFSRLTTSFMQWQSLKAMRKNVHLFARDERARGRQEKALLGKRCGGSGVVNVLWCKKSKKIIAL